MNFLWRYWPMLLILGGIGVGLVVVVVLGAVALNNQAAADQATANQPAGKLSAEKSPEKQNNKPSLTLAAWKVQRPKKATLLVQVEYASEEYGLCVYLSDDTDKLVKCIVACRKEMRSLLADGKAHQLLVTISPDGAGGDKMPFVESVRKP